MILAIRKILAPVRNERGDGDSFRTMNVCLNMLLLAFFIALNSVAVQDEARVRKALGSLIGSFGILPGGVNPFGGDGTQINLPGDAPMVKIESMQSFLNSIEKYALTKGFGKGFGVTKEGEYLVMRMTDKMLFEEGGLSIKKDVSGMLDEISAFLNSMTREIRILGHTDDAEVVEGSETNWSYSASKSLVVAKYLIDRGVNPKRILVIAYGDSRPMLPNDTEEHRAKNRRVEILFKEG